MACHGDESLKLLADPTQHEKAFLSGVSFSRNRAVLHFDEKVFP